MKVDLKAYFRHIWTDPVWSKVIAQIIIFLGGGVAIVALGAIWVSGRNNTETKKTEVRTPARHKDSPLIINGTAYQMPTSSSPYCVAEEIYTGLNNIVTYDIVVPDGWVMMWDSRKAKWEGGAYNDNGLLIIRGPYSGKIEINTGGSCSGPIEWYDFILKNRREAYRVPSRPEYTIPKSR